MTFTVVSLKAEGDSVAVYKASFPLGLTLRAALHALLRASSFLPHAPCDLPQYTWQEASRDAATWLSGK